MNEKYEGSYTKKVVDDLTRELIKLLRCTGLSLEAIQAGDAAAALLKQYHEDCHLPYQQRDEARAELAALKKDFQTVKKRGDLLATDRYFHKVRAEALRARFREAQLEIRTLKQEIRMQNKAAQQQANLQNAGAQNAGSVPPPEPANWKTVFHQPASPTTWFRCDHYPLATNNFFHNRTTCEKGCHNEPLKWWDSGTHREPK